MAQLLQYSTFSPQSLESEFNTSIESGLTDQQAKLNLQKFGPNLFQRQKTSAFSIFLTQFKSSFVYLLIFASLVSFFLGDLTNALLILGFITINSLLGFYQEYKSHHTMQLLQKLIASQVTIIRNNQELIIDSQNLLPGDLVKLKPGDILKADLRIIKSENLSLDESVLTGETNPVFKTDQTSSTPPINLFKAQNLGFSGTTIISGSGLGIVIATAKNTQIGLISDLSNDQNDQSNFTNRLNELSRFIIRLTSLSLILLFTLNLSLKGLSQLTELALFSVAMAVSIIPEALPTVTIFALTQAAMRLSKNKVIIKRLSTLEDLGGLQILCTDKTGTLTENKLSLADHFSQDLPAAVFLGCLAKESTLTTNLTNPIDQALFNQLDNNQLNQLKNYQLIISRPFDPFSKINTVLVKNQHQAFQISRGAPEEILKLTQNNLKPEIKKFIEDQGQLGRRLIAIASTKIGSSTTKIRSKTLQLNAIFSFEDPLKLSSQKAILAAEKIGLQIKILTGDRPEIAANLAKKIGLITNLNQVITGDQFFRLKPNKQVQALKHLVVFSRVTPEQKHQLVQMMKKTAKVGFLGEGINDAPAIKTADVGLVVNNATDLAKDSADIILMQKSLIPIITAVTEGRKVFQNTHKYLLTTLTSNFGNFFALSIASLSIKFLPMLAVQILLLNLLSDFPMIAIATDNVDPEHLEKPSQIQFKSLTTSAVSLGLISTVFDLIFFFIFLRQGQAQLQTYWFIASVLTELALLFSLRSQKTIFRQSTPSFLIMFISLLAASMAIFIPLTSIGRNFFHFIKPEPPQLILIFSLVLVYFILNELIKNQPQKLFGGKDWNRTSI